MLLQYLHWPCINNPSMYIGSASFHITDVNLRDLRLEPTSMKEPNVVIYIVISGRTGEHIIEVNTYHL